MFFFLSFGFRCRMITCKVLLWSSLFHLTDINCIDFSTFIHILLPCDGQQIQELMEAIVLPMTHKERFDNLGIRPPKGVLLYGPPGTGKTLMARACAAQTNATYLKLAGPQLVQVISCYCFSALNDDSGSVAHCRSIRRVCSENVLFLSCYCFSAINDDNCLIINCWTFRRVFLKDVLFIQHRCL